MNDRVYTFLTISFKHSPQVCGSLPKAKSDRSVPDNSP